MELEGIVEKVLKGIDLEEIESEDGWWETSIGAEFGKRKKEELLKALRCYLMGFSPIDPGRGREAGC